MLSLWDSYWKILKLDSAPFEAVKQAKDGFWFALKLFAVVGLIAGLGKLTAISRIMETPTLPERTNKLALNIETFAEDSLPRFLVKPAHELAGVIRDVETTLSNLQPPVGARPSRIVRLVGDWLSTPFEMMATWMGFMLLIFIFARALGGQGTLAHHVSLLSLAVVPQVLTIVNYAPLQTSLMNAPTGMFGRLLSLIALLWSLAIVTKALSIAHDIENNQALKILVIFVLVIFVLLPLLSTLGSAYILEGAL